MTMSKVKIETQTEFAPTPSVFLTEKVGSKLVGTLHKKVASDTYPGKTNYLINVKETDAPIRLYDKEKKESTDVDITAGDKVWLKGTTILSSALDQIAEGTDIEIIFKGKGEAKKGQKPPFLFDVFKVED